MFVNSLLGHTGPPLLFLAVFTFPSAEMLVLQVVFMHLKALQKVVLLGNREAVSESVADNAAEGASGGEQASLQLVGLQR